MTTLDTLPNDILNIIFDLLARTDLLSSYVMMSLTSPRFYQLIDRHANNNMLTKYVCNHEIAFNGYLEILKRTKLDEDNIYLNRIWYWAAFGGHMDILEWAREQEYQFDCLVCTGAAEGGHLNILKWAREKNYPWDSQVCVRAARNGHLDILKWARSNGCPWNSQTCEKAAKYGRFEVLQWAKSNGCVLGDVRKYAANEGHLHILKYAKEQGMRIGNLTALRAARYGHLHVLKWTKEIGVRWSDKTKMIIEKNWPNEFN